MLRLVSLLGLICLLLEAWGMSEDRRKVPWRILALGLGLQFAIPFEDPQQLARPPGGVLAAALQQGLDHAASAAAPACSPPTGIRRIQ